MCSETQEPQLTTVKLYGHLANKFGESFQFLVRSPREAIAALIANFPDFKNAIKDNAYHIFVNREDIGEDELLNPTGTRTIEIVPLIVGSKAFFKIVLGIALIGVGLFLAPAGLLGAEGITATTLIGTALKYVGTALLFSGISELLFSPPKMEDTEPVQSRPSFLFQGAVNTVTQGGPVPVGYGRLMIGSTVIGASISTKDI